MLWLFCRLVQQYVIIVPRNNQAVGRHLIDADDVPSRGNVPSHGNVPANRVTLQHISDRDDIIDAFVHLYFPNNSDVRFPSDGAANA